MVSLPSTRYHCKLLQHTVPTLLQRRCILGWLRFCSRSARIAFISGLLSSPASQPPSSHLDPAVPYHSLPQWPAARSSSLPHTTATSTSVIKWNSSLLGRSEMDNGTGRELSGFEIHSCPWMQAGMNIQVSSKRREDENDTVNAFFVFYSRG